MNSKRLTTPVSLQSVYMRSIAFHVERFEEWQQGRCTKSGSLNFDLRLVADGNSISVSIPQNEQFNIEKYASFSFLGSDVLPDRVQYVNISGFSMGPTVPVVLHIFVKNGAIECIRFAMTAPDRIVEFYGYQIEG